MSQMYRWACRGNFHQVNTAHLRSIHQCASKPQKGQTDQNDRTDDLKCWLFLHSHDSTQPGRRDVRDVEKYSEIWAAAVAVNEMCIKQGKLGTALGLGKLESQFPRCFRLDDTAPSMQQMANSCTNICLRRGETPLRHVRRNKISSHSLFTVRAVDPSYSGCGCRHCLNCRGGRYFYCIFQARSWIGIPPSVLRKSARLSTSSIFNSP
jgi:hypothetical protein